MTEIKFDGQLTKDDFLKAQKLHQRPTGQATRVRVSLLFFVFFLAILFFVQDVSNWLYAVLLIVPALAITSPWWMPYYTAATFNDASKIFQEPIQGTITQAGITLQGANFSSKMGWDAYTGCVLDEEIVLLYQGRRGFNFLVKRLFKDDMDWKNFIEIARIKALKKSPNKSNKTPESTSTS